MGPVQEWKDTDRGETTFYPHDYEFRREGGVNDDCLSFCHGYTRSQWRLEKKEVYRSSGDRFFAAHRPGLGFGPRLTRGRVRHNRLHGSHGWLHSQERHL